MLDLLLDEGLLESLDVHFARTLQRLGGASDPLVGLGAALASAAPRLGDVCVDLPDLTSGPPLNPDGEAIDAKWPELDGWLEALRASPRPKLSSRLGSGQMGSRRDITPLVPQHERLWPYSPQEMDSRLGARRLVFTDPTSEDVRPCRIKTRATSWPGEWTASSEPDSVSAGSS